MRISSYIYILFIAFNPKNQQQQQLIPETANTRYSHYSHYSMCYMSTRNMSFSYTNTNDGYIYSYTSCI